MNIKYDAEQFNKKELYRLKRIAQGKGFDIYVGNSDYVMPSPYKRDVGKNKLVKVHAFAVTKDGEFIAGFDRREKIKKVRILYIAQ